MTRNLEFTLTVSPCLGCHFCAQDKLAAAYKSDKRKMSLSDFEIILNKVPDDVIFDFSGMSEPFLNPDACSMMALAKMKGRTVRVFSTLMGLKSGCVDVLAFHKPHYWRCHAPDTKGLKIPDAVWIKQYELFLQANIPHTVMAMGPLTPGLKSYFDSRSVNVELPEMLSRAGNLWQDRDFKGRITCNADRYFQNVILPSGDVVGCCHLYSMEIVLGNLLTEPYSAIHERAQAWANDKNPPSNSPCRKCSWAKPI